MDFEQAVDYLYPGVKHLGARFINAKQQRDTYNLGVADVSSFAHHVARIVNTEDQRWHGMAVMNRYFQMCSDGMELPKDPDDGMKMFNKEANWDKVPHDRIRGLLEYMTDLLGTKTDGLYPVATCLMARFMNATRRHVQYAAGVADLATLSTLIIALVNRDDPRWKGMFSMSELLQKCSVEVGVPENPNVGMEVFTKEEKPLPLPETHIRKLAGEILEDLNKSTTAAHEQKVQTPERKNPS